MESLVSWKQKRDRYSDEADEDELGVRGPRLTNTIQESKFIMRDETNARTMRRLKIKW